ncbi:hypothetical protein [Rhizobium phaseoli]|uniref:hypothetical protein n=1 Tax=Rhizobium phaseoli TaxID=396 RepID=UPI002552CE9F|nr:hypothetical protein [Rhizobium phaseoli]MDK4729348.1 hypothetical protein [Rhizobium phaseoli]
MEENVKWILGFLLSLIVAGTSYARYVSNMIKAGDENLHHRINQTRDEYVKRVDLDAHISRVESRMRDLREELRADIKDIKDEQKGTNARLDSILAKLTERNARPH